MATWYVNIIESEAGWGQRVDETQKFRSKKKADEFVESFNSHNTAKTVPSWYMHATKPYQKN